MSSREPSIPDGLHRAGKQLWSSVTNDYEIEQHEALLLSIGTSDARDARCLHPTGPDKAASGRLRAS